MAKVIIFSRTFPSYHPRKGEPTYFVEKILKGLPHTGMQEPNGIEIDLGMIIEAHTKYHTIRAGHRWKEGDWFSPKVWGDDINPKSGRKGPYHSKQIQFAPDIQIKKVWDFEISGNDGKFFIYQSPFTSKGIFVNEVANNDGLTVDDFKSWFRYPNHFDGQIICWNENINY